MPACASSGVYAPPRDTHRCDAAVLVRHHVARFLERVEEGGHGPLPDFVQAEQREVVELRRLRTELARLRRRIFGMLSIMPQYSQSFHPVTQS